MPREYKGRSPQFITSKERLPLALTLDKLHSLLVGQWNIPNSSFVIVDEVAYVLQDYDIQGPEIQSGHLDVYIDPLVLSWPDKEERSIIPPKDSGYLSQYSKFMKETGYGLDLLRGNPRIFEVPTVEYPLPSGNIIHLMRAYEMTNAFVRSTIMHYSLKDVDADKIKEWVNKITLIEEAATRKGDQELALLCRNRYQESMNKWQHIYI